MRCAEAKNSYFLCSHIHFCWIIASDKQLRFWLCIGENRRQSKHWWMKEWNARPNVNAKRFEYVIWHIDYELNTNKMRRPFALLCFIMHGMACSVMSVPKWPNDIPGSSRLFLFARRISSDRYIYILMLPPPKKSCHRKLSLQNDKWVFYATIDCHTMTVHKKTARVTSTRILWCKFVAMPSNG